MPIRGALTLAAVALCALLAVPATAAVPKIEASPAFGANGTILITWDEGADPPQDPDHVLLAALGPLVRPGYVDRARHDHYGLERTLAEGFGVPALAHARHAQALSAIWR